MSKLAKKNIFTILTTPINDDNKNTNDYINQSINYLVISTTDNGNSQSRMSLRCEGEV